MQVTLDKSGRVLIPKEARKQLGMSPGDHFDVRVEDDRLVLSPPTQGKLVRENGILVWDGEVGDFDVVELIDKLREERNKVVSGMDW